MAEEGRSEEEVLLTELSPEELEEVVGVGERGSDAVSKPLPAQRSFRARKEQRRALDLTSDRLEAAVKHAAGDGHGASPSKKPKRKAS